GSVANACQYFSAALAPRSDGGSAWRVCRGTPRIARDNITARSMSDSLRERDRDDRNVSNRFARSLEQVGGNGRQKNQRMEFPKRPGEGRGINPRRSARNRVPRGDLRGSGRGLGRSRLSGETAGIALRAVGLGPREHGQNRRRRGYADQADP